jgi:hypothetical protein
MFEQDFFIVWDLCRICSTEGMTGVDILPNLLEQASARAQREGVHVQFDEGDVALLPYPKISVLGTRDGGVLLTLLRSAAAGIRHPAPGQAAELALGPGALLGPIQPGSQWHHARRSQIS